MSDDDHKIAAFLFSISPEVVITLMTLVESAVVIKNQGEKNASKE
jgi:hypothetical protein